MKIFNFFCFLFAIAFIASCNNSSTPVDTNNNNPTLSTYFPITVGSWWDYKSLVDKENNTYSYDSTVVVANVTKYDKECQMFVTFYDLKGSIYTDTSYYYVDKTRVFYLMRGIESDKLAWYEFVDFDADYLGIAHQNTVDIEIAPDSLFTGIEKLESYKEGNETLNIAGTNVNCIKYKVVYSFDGVIKTNDGNSSEYKKELYNIFYWYGENLGLVKTVYKDLEYVSELQNYLIVK